MDYLRLSRSFDLEQKKEKLLSLDVSYFYTNHTFLVDIPSFILSLYLLRLTRR